jgi:hypothetical protein
VRASTRADIRRLSHSSSSLATSLLGDRSVDRSSTGQSLARLGARTIEMGTRTAGCVHSSAESDVRLVREQRRRRVGYPERGFSGVLGRGDGGGRGRLRLPRPLGVLPDSGSRRRGRMPGCVRGGAVGLREVLAGHGLFLERGRLAWVAGQEYSGKVPQQAGTQVVLDGRGRTVTCTGRRMWTLCHWMACKRSGVRIPIAPQGISGQSADPRPSGWVPRSVDRDLTVVLGGADRHAAARIGPRWQVRRTRGGVH